MLLHLALMSAARADAVPLDDAFSSAAEEFQVPEVVLKALSWEASHWNPDVVSEVGGGQGLLGLRDTSDGPSLTLAAELLDVDPATLLTDPVLQIRGGAALLLEQWNRAHPGRRPDPTDLAAWWDPVRAFSATSSPVRQDRYTTYIFEVIERGATDGALELPPTATGLSLLAPPPPPGSVCDFPGCADYEQASVCNYSNDSRGTAAIDMVVIHTVQGSYEGCISWFADCDAGASAHYVVRSDDGAITQMVDESDIAWHAGDWDTNERSIGIEHEGYIEVPEDYYTDAMYKASADLVIDIAARTGVSLDRDSIIGHDEVPGCPSGDGGGASCHTDPGEGWDWDYYMSLMTGETAGTLQGIVADSDIYNGVRVTGASVWLEGSPETCVSGSVGEFAFEGLPLDHYVVWAEAPGYDPGRCSIDLAVGTNWCSIALFASSDPPEEDDTGDGPPEDTGVSDTGTEPEDTGPSETTPPVQSMQDDDAQLGCACGTTGAASSGALATLFLALLVPFRRRR